MATLKWVLVEESTRPVGPLTPDALDDLEMLFGKDAALECAKAFGVSDPSAV